MKTLLVITLLLFAGSPAHAKLVYMTRTMPCDATKAITDSLEGKYHEQTMGGGLTKQGELIRLFVSDTNTFTILITKPDGISCVFGVGDDWLKSIPVYGEPS